MKNCPLCNTPPKRYGFGNYYCPNEECNLYATPVTKEQWNNRPIEQQLVDALQKLRREHHVCEEDNWFSCPKSGQCLKDGHSDQCDCGADEANSLIDAVLQSNTGGTPCIKN